MAKWQIKPEFEKAKSEGKLEKLYEALRGWLNRKSAMVYAWLNIQTVYDRMEKMPDFSMKLDDSEHYWLAVVENAKHKKIVDEQYRPAIEKELKSKLHKVYWDKSEIEHTWEITQSIIYLPEKPKKE